jgi:site-specific DNA-cytosine methylase
VIATGVNGSAGDCCQTFKQDALNITTEPRWMAQQTLPLFSDYIRSPEFFDRECLEVTDLFCGGGGTSTGILRAGFKLRRNIQLLAINHWPTAIQTHSLNHPNVRHLCESLDNIDPRKLAKRLHLLAASPECFPAGTLILTEDGYMPIEEVKIGKKVLTHKNRWRAVTTTFSKEAPAVVVKGQGHPGLETTEDHPFWIRKRVEKHRPDASGWFRYSDPIWQSPANMRLNKPTLWASPTEIPALEIPEVGGRGMEFSTTFFEFVGWYLAEGGCRIRKGNSEVWLSPGKHEANVLEAFLDHRRPLFRSRFNELQWRRRDIRTATLFETGHDGLARWLVNNFGKHAGGKHIPSWAYGMPVEWRSALLRGYCSGDGHIERPGYLGKRTCVTIGKSLAIGIKTLASTLGYRTSVHYQKPRLVYIEGRRVQCKEAFAVAWTIKSRRHDGLNDGQHYWTLVNKVNRTGNVKRVYNLSVEDDESYVAEGIVVHNCTHHSSARGGKPCSDQSRATAWHILRWAEAIPISNILIENVPELLTWAPLDNNGRPIKAKKGQIFEAFIGALRSLNYSVQWRVINCANYGDPTSRQRLIILCNKGKLIPWPDESHADPDNCPEDKLPWRTAREIIDWDLVGKSIFGRKRPLKDTTLLRVLFGVKKFSAFGIEPFLVQLRGTAPSQIRSSAKSLDEPLPTISAGGFHTALVQPFMIHTTHQGSNRRCHSLDKPAPTITGANRGEMALIEPRVTRMEDFEIEGEVEAILEDDRCLLIDSASGRTIAEMDILLRMLQPHELAAGMSFPGNYVFTGKTKGDKVKQIGNAVPVETAAAMAGALLAQDARRN